MLGIDEEVLWQGFTVVNADAGTGGLKAEEDLCVEK